MKNISILVFAIMLLISAIALADKADSFAQAKTLSVNSELPIFLEFVHDD